MPEVPCGIDTMLPHPLLVPSLSARVTRWPRHQTSLRYAALVGKTCSGPIRMHRGLGCGGCGRSSGDSTWVLLRLQAEHTGEGTELARCVRGCRVPCSGVRGYPRGCRQITVGPVGQLLQETGFRMSWRQAARSLQFPPLHAVRSWRNVWTLEGKSRETMKGTRRNI